MYDQIKHTRSTFTIIGLVVLTFCLTGTIRAAELSVRNVRLTQADPVVPGLSKASAQQDTSGDRSVHIYYDLEIQGDDTAVISVVVSDDGGKTYKIIPKVLSGDVGLGVTAGANKHVVWDVLREMPGQHGTAYRAKIHAHIYKTITIEIPNLPEDLMPLEMIMIPAGTFTMGSDPFEEDRRDDEGPQHQVTIRNSFYLGKYEITQGQWTALMGSNPMNESNKMDNAVAGLSWDDCQAFIQPMNALGQGTFRLPTEAEWEYACRAGTTTRFYWGDDPLYSLLSQYGGGLSAGLVGQKAPNAWGLFDMSGNAAEWCQDLSGPYSAEHQVDPQGPLSGSAHIFRGGAWPGYGDYYRSARRGGAGDNKIGLRLFRLYP